MKTVLVYSYLPKSLEESVLILSNILRAKREMDVYQGHHRFLDVTLGDRCYVSFSSFGGASEGLLKTAIKDFIKVAGNPYFVKGNYNLVEDTLKLSGKGLERRFYGCAVGKHVVDLK